MTLQELDTMEALVCWLKAALQCQSWHWDCDQREAAEHTLHDANRILLEYSRGDYHDET